MKHVKQKKNKKFYFIPKNYDGFLTQKIRNNIKQQIELISNSYHNNYIAYDIYCPPGGVNTS